MDYITHPGQHFNPKQSDKFHIVFRENIGSDNILVIKNYASSTEKDLETSCKVKNLKNQQKPNIKRQCRQHAMVKHTHTHTHGHANTRRQRQLLALSVRFPGDGLLSPFNVTVTCAVIHIPQRRTYSEDRTAAAAKHPHRQSCFEWCCEQRWELPGHDRVTAHCWFWHPRGCDCIHAHNIHSIITTAEEINTVRSAGNFVRPRRRVEDQRQTINDCEDEDRNKQIKKVTNNTQKRLQS